MNRPKIDLIKESLPLVDERTAKGTVTHLVEYIEYLEKISVGQPDVQQKACFHHWVDAKNAVIESGRYCTKCHTIAPDA